MAKDTLLVMRTQTIIDEFVDDSMLSEARLDTFSSMTGVKADGQIM